ncbi:MAG TPA: DUF1360 domain-containing protein [Acidobacteriaceae bacterium]|nr:DUF1360 domain-containing protein [Acidobacteriaceae bacterium]
MALVLAVLATWRVTHLLANEDGPADIVVRLRKRLGDGFLGSLMDCFYCLSMWIAAPAALFVTRKPLEWLMTWLALSGGACLLERLGKQPEPLPVVIEPLPVAAESSTEGEIDDVLRTETLPEQRESSSGAPEGSPERPAIPAG